MVIFPFLYNFLFSLEFITASFLNWCYLCTYFQSILNLSDPVELSIWSSTSNNLFFIIFFFSLSPSFSPSLPLLPPPTSLSLFLLLTLFLSFLRCLSWRLICSCASILLSYISLVCRLTEVIQLPFTIILGIFHPLLCCIICFSWSLLLFFLGLVP